MRLKRQDLRKIIIEILLKEVDDENLRGPRTVAPLARPFVKLSNDPQEVEDKSGNLFSVSPTGDITFLGTRDKKIANPITFDGDKKLKVASNLIDDQKSMGKNIPSGLKAIIRDIDYEIVDEGEYRFKIFPSGQIFLLSKSGKLINKEIIGQNKIKTAETLQRLFSDRRQRPYLFSISTNLSSLTSSGPDKKASPKKGIQYYPGYDGKILTNNIASIEPKKEKDMVVGACTAEGCAQFVRETLGSHVGNFVGNAWHAHGRFAKESAFNSLTTAQQAEAALIFSKINKNPKEKSLEGEVRKFIKKIIPDQSQFNDLALGDVVGLYYNPSDNFTKAFFEGATGRNAMGIEPAPAEGPFFLTPEGKKWNPDLLGQKIEFKPGKTLENGKGFGMNTHIGFVGAILDGVPIIYHNVHHMVKATGLEAMNKNGLSIVWAGRLAKS